MEKIIHPSLILWPVLAQVALTIVMYALLAIRKAKVVRSGGFNRQSTALDNKAWPADVVKVSNNIDNQFESPILFYVVCLVLYSTNGVSVTVLALAWVYVLSRCVHAYVHTHSNYVPARLRVFMVGIVVLVLLVVSAAWQLAK